MSTKLLKLNKNEEKWINNLFEDIYDDNELEELKTEYRMLKTFLKELKKVQKKYGYEPHEATIFNAIIYFGQWRYEEIEEFIYCFKDDLATGAQRYFETYY